MAKSMFLDKLKAIGESKGLKAPEGYGVMREEVTTSDMSLEDHVKAIKSMPDFDLVAVIKMLVDESDMGDMGEMLS